jgi:hypothetical protein
MLSFLSPLFLAGAAAAAVPIVLHLLKREPEDRVKFAPVKLIRQAPVEHTDRRRLRELLLLALRVTALVLLALAFARPFLATGAAVGSTGVTVVVLDTSYSLAAPGRFERAKQLAKEAIARAPAGDLVGVVTFADEAEIVARPGSDRTLATDAIEQASVGFGATRYRTALSAASQHLAGRHGTIVIVTDLQESGWDAGDRASVPDGTAIQIADVGAMPPNLAITAVQPMPDRVVATVHNAGPRPRDARVHLRIDNRPAGDATVSLGANQAADATFAGAPRGAAAAVSVEDRDGIQADNIRYAVIGSGAGRPSVLLVTGSGDASRDAFYLQHALAAGTGADPAFQIAATGGASLAGWSEDRLTPHAAVVLLSSRGLERRGRELLAAYAQHGGGILIAAGPEVDGDVVGDVLGAGSTLHIVTVDGRGPAPRVLAPVDGRHPVFGAFAANPASLGLVTFQNAARIGGSACQTLARFTTGDTALIECPAGDGRGLVLASDLNNRWNDFPLHATFVPFVHEVVRYLASGRAHAIDYLVGDAPAGARRAPGIVTLNDAARGGGPRTIAVNVDPREADPARLSADEFQSAVARLKETGGVDTRGEAREQEDRQQFWRYALAAMALLLAAEGVLAARTA